jgi:hypothetical protein
MSEIRDISGIRFKSLVAKRRVGSDKKGHAMWLCVCDCGNDFVTISNKLLTGNTGTCGCRNGHGQRHTRLYRTWINMKQRCYNPNSKNYQWYGGKGIVVCGEWVDSFQHFMLWALVSGYSNDLTIDRIDAEEGYSPDNCQWVTVSENVKKKVISKATREKISNAVKSRGVNQCAKTQA